MGIAILLIYRFSNLSPWLLIGIAAITFLGFQLNKKLKLKSLDWVLEKLERAEIKKQFPGMGFCFFLTGAGLSLLLFPKASALAGIAVLGFGDSASNIFGQLFGRVKHPSWISTNKTVEGSLAGFAAGLLGALIFVNPVKGVIAASCGTVFEALDIKYKGQKLEDNLLIPIFSALAASLV